MLQAAATIHAVAGRVLKAASGMNLMGGCGVFDAGVGIAAIGAAARLAVAAAFARHVCFAVCGCVCVGH